MEKIKFWKIFFGSGSVTLFNVIRAFLVNKLLAVFLPPAAFACVGQFMNLMTIGEATSSMSMQSGWTSLSAQNKSDREKLLGVWHGGFRMTTMATVLTCVVAVIFCFVAPLDIVLPGVPTRLAQAAILFALPGMVAMNIVSISAAVMNGLGEMRKWALINIVSSLWQMAWVAFFLYTGRLSVLSIVATQSIVASIFAIQISASAGFSFNQIRKTYLEIRGPWISYALMGIVPMIMTPVALMVIRSFVGSSMGWEAAGVWQGINKISDFFASVFSAVLGVIILPKVSAKMSLTDFRGVFRPVFMRLVCVSAALMVGIYFCRHFVVALFLSSAYSGAADYLHFQLLGDLFRSAGWCFGFVLIARSETKAFLGIEIFSQLFLLAATYVGIRLFEFNGPMMAYALENFVTLVALAVVTKRLQWNR